MKILKILIFLSLFVMGIIFMNFLISKEKREVVSINEEIYSGIIVIDPGHGGEDTGAISQNNVNEKDVVLDISLKLGEKLEENNFKVYFTRKSDKALGNTVRSDIINRAKFINARNADIFLSIHLNGSDVESAKGVESYSRFLDDKSYLLAESIQDELSSIEYTKDRGIKETNEKSLGILRYTNITGVLLELGFITNSEDEKYLISEEGQDIIVYCILNGILNYFNEIK
ncbi:N-acetylmuramoyl-L-alanine amidase [Candidatus Arthromitus sp. SFB-turkey]|nr:N-acetylmuramoyl-L-alanine amidase [Candidatus Arthromitus sp. SFB-turkey]